MGTKNNPGKFDCYANAEPDEPLFVLLGRDKHAPALVEYWAILRAADGEEQEKINEALECSHAMREYLDQKKKRAAWNHVVTFAVIREAQPALRIEENRNDG